MLKILILRKRKRLHLLYEEILCSCLNYFSKRAVEAVRQQVNAFYFSCQATPRRKAGPSYHYTICYQKVKFLVKTLQHVGATKLGKSYNEEGRNKIRSSLRISIRFKLIIVHKIFLKKIREFDINKGFHLIYDFHDTGSSCVISFFK